MPNCRARSSPAVLVRPEILGVRRNGILVPAMACCMEVTAPVRWMGIKSRLSA